MGIKTAIYNWRLAQALKIADMRREPKVIKALHKALREHEPLYLKNWQDSQNEVGDAVDDLLHVMEWLREGEHYDEADRIRTIAGRLARSRKYPFFERKELLRSVAKTFR